MDRYFEEYPDYQRKRIQNLLANQGHNDLVAASLSGTPLAKTPSGGRFLFITTPAESTVVEIKVSTAIFQPDVPVMDLRNMKVLET